jgi:hypothetical protein
MEAVAELQPTYVRLSQLTILGMGEDTPNINLLRGEEYHGNQTVVVALDIEYVPIVGDVVAGGKILFNGVVIAPLCLVYDVEPQVKCLSSLGILSGVLADGKAGNDVHGVAY